MEVLAQERVLTGLDHARLSALLFRPRVATALPPGLADAAQDLLDLAEVVDAITVDADVVTMRSRVRLTRTGQPPFAVTLSYPSPTGLSDGCVSVLTPLGLSLLGTRAGRWIRWAGPTGEVHSAQVTAVEHQPEAAGDYDA